MPSPTEIRKQRIESLVEYGLQNDTWRIDPLLKIAFKKWPFLEEETRLSYCVAALQILRKTILLPVEPIPQQIDVREVTQIE